MEQQSKRVVISPWWEMTNPIDFRGFTFIPVDAAIDRYPELRDSLAVATARFCTGYMYPKAEANDAFFNGEDVELRPQRTKPTIAVLGDDQSYVDAREAIDAIAFASMSTWDVGGIYINSAVFESRQLRCGKGDGFVVEETRRMTGSAQNLYEARMRIETKLQSCGSFLYPDETLLSALELLATLNERESFGSAFATLNQARRDDSYVPMNVESAFYALVITNLLADVTSDDTEDGQARAIAAFLDPRVKGGASNIVNAYRATRLNRNATWHPKPRQRPLYAFEEQEIVPLSLIYFRMVEAVVIARLVHLGCIDPESKLAAKVAAIDLWIGDLGKLVGEKVEPPKSGMEQIALMERFEQVASVSKKWLDAWSHLIIARVAQSSRQITV